mmetsp:Transcript_18964/g.61832  ORF Transcript_18964/g.61832 Transcript_18964/m.61832 type:complete len:139 (+) Transcript_18964:6-422(+)
MAGLASFALSAGHGFFAFGHLTNPIETALQMLEGVGTIKDEGMTAHCIAVIGCLHAFVSVLLLMAALIKDAGLRKCILGIYLVTFIPASLYVQFAFPPMGAPPATLTSMPLPILYTFGVAALFGVVFGKSSSSKDKAN